MALGDGDSWDETNPTDGTVAVQIDDYNRDLRKGIRGRMAIEHEWPSSQSATNESGAHKYITLQNQASKPTIAGTQLAAFYTKTVGAGLQEAFFEDELGTEIQLTDRGGLKKVSNTVLQTVTTRFSAVATSTVGSFTINDTIPDITAGTELMRIVVTAQDGTSPGYVHVEVNLHAGSAFSSAISLFKDTTEAAIESIILFGNNSPNSINNRSFTHFISAGIGTTASIPYIVRIAAPTTEKVTFNGFDGTRILGGVIISKMIFQEIKA